MPAKASAGRVVIAGRASSLASQLLREIGAGFFVGAGLPAKASAGRAVIAEWACSLASQLLREIGAGFFVGAGLPAKASAGRAVIAEWACSLASQRLRGGGGIDLGVNKTGVLRRKYFVLQMVGESAFNAPFSVYCAAFGRFAWP
ncbi:hypothetical protein A9971_17435 [Pseudomonas sp. UME65]|nr:hypothetical protein [Pseudomonas sp. UME65]